eukprot:COSAG01_NODE_793_length_13551_cov_466.357419_7_plen_284_part_00
MGGAQPPPPPERGCQRTHDPASLPRAKAGGAATPAVLPSRVCPPDARGARGAAAGGRHADGSQQRQRLPAAALRRGVPGAPHRGEGRRPFHAQPLGHSTAARRGRRRRRVARGCGARGRARVGRAADEALLLAGIGGAPSGWIRGCVWPFPYLGIGSILTEIYLSHACSCQEILRMPLPTQRWPTVPPSISAKAPAPAPAPARASPPGRCASPPRGSGPRAGSRALPPGWTRWTPGLTVWGRSWGRLAGCWVRWRRTSSTRASSSARHGRRWPCGDALRAVAA